MGEIAIIVGSKDNIAEDIKVYLEKISKSYKIQIVSKKDIKQVVLNNASTLFMEENIILVLVDPEKNQLKELKDHLQILKNSMNIIIYLYAPPVEPLPIEGAITFVVEQEKDKRIRGKVLSILKRHGKIMTDKGFSKLKEKVKDEIFLEMELMKLINYVGDRREIKSGDVEAIVTETYEENLLTFFEIISKKDKRGVIENLKNLLESGLSVIEIQAFLIKQTRLMLHGKDMEDLFRMHREFNAFLKVFNRWREAFENLEGERKLYLPFQNKYYAYKLINTGTKFTREELINLMNRFAYTDGKLKSGTKHDRIYLEQSLIEV